MSLTNEFAAPRPRFTCSAAAARRRARPSSLILPGALVVTGLLTLLGASPRPAAAADCVIGEYLQDNQGNPLCWPPNKQITICFNPQLDGRLDTPTGPGDRWVAFQAACASWNAALIAVGSQIRLNPVNQAACWSIMQANSPCTDPDHLDDQNQQLPVYEYTWNDDPMPDGSSDCSTGQPVNAPPGWVKDPAAVIQYSQFPDSVRNDILARCRPLPNVNPMTEADIAWFTHVEAPNGCPVIPWNFNAGITPGNFPRQYDYYSVMLHELGHLLGLGHAKAGETGVMAPSISANTRSQITDEERECLKKCLPAVNPVEVLDWGRIKSTYR